MRTLTSFLVDDISGEGAPSNPHRASTRSALLHCNYLHKQATLIPVSSSGNLQSLWRLDMIHDAFVRGRQEDEEIRKAHKLRRNSKLSHSAAGQHQGFTKDFISEALLSFPLQSELSLPLINSSKIQHQNYKTPFFFQDSYKLDSTSTHYIEY